MCSLGNYIHYAFLFIFQQRFQANLCRFSFFCCQFMKYQILVGFYSFIIFSTLNSYYSSSQFLAQEDYEGLQHLIWHHRLRKNRLHQMFFSNLIVFVDLGCRCRLSSTSLKIYAFILVLCHPFQFLSLFALQFALQFQIAF